MRKFLAPVLICSVVLSQPLKAQNYYYYNSKYYDSPVVFEIGASFGAMNSFTDLGGRKGVGKSFIKDLRWKTIRPSYGVYLMAMYNNALGIRLEGTFGTTARMCPGIPDTFYHTNVLARLLPAPPVIHAMRRESDAIRFEFVAEAPYDYSVEFCDAFCATDWRSLTNFHATLGTVDALVVDATTNSPARFYRIRKQLRM